MSTISIPTTNIPGLSTANPSSEVKPAQMVRKLRTAVESKNGWWWGTGRRKRAVARVRMKPSTAGAGIIKVQINAAKFKTVDQYFAETRDRNDCAAPLKISNLLGNMDVIVRCNGGGFMGQAQAVRLGIARALRDYDPTLDNYLFS